MRRPVAIVLALLMLAPAGEAAAPPATPAPPPHAWLFGAWTGGLFPALGATTAQACLAQPVVIFTRDVVLRASLTDPSYAQRVVGTARTRSGVTDFQFTPVAEPATGSGLLGVTQPKPASGFGCENPDVLHVQWRNDNEIAFPGCADFPEPLVRCPGR